MTELLRPYVPRPVIDWLRETPDQAYREVRGSFVFADISGFTTLTERLAQQGKVGAEEMGDILNSTFARLLVPAYDYGAALIKWGGDAGLLLFTGDNHPARACRAAVEMQAVMRRVGRLRTSAGGVQLGMSIGVHSGSLDFFLVGTHHRELIVTGPAATTVAEMEKVASSGQVVISTETAAAISRSSVGPPIGDGFLLQQAPHTSPYPQRTPVTAGLELAAALPDAIADHVSSGIVDSEHRVVTTGFIQFLGVDRAIAAQGPAAVADALERLVDVTAAAAARHGVTFLASDIGADGGKLILVAGAPRTHDRADDRMLCALRQVLDEATPMTVRAGTTTGRVFAGDFGPPYRRTYSVVGDSVNLAARLMAHASPGQLVATPEVVERSRTTFETTSLAPFRVKGKSEPIRAVAVGAALPPSRGQRSAALPLVGRRTEFEHLVRRLEQVRSGAGAVVQLVGGTGSGKTRLVDEIVARADREYVVGVVCDGYTAATPYRPWRQLLQEVTASCAPARLDPAQAFVHVVQRRCKSLLPWLPLLGTVLDLDFEPTPEVDQLEERFRRSRLAQVVVELLTTLLQTPTVLTFDDVHLADEASRELLQAVVRVAQKRPWLVVITRRDEAETPDASREAPFSSSALVLRPLTQDESIQLLEQATEDQPLAGHVLERLSRAAEGNPLFLHELLDAHRRVGDEASLPDSLEGILAASIDALPPEPRRVLRTISVLGSRFQRHLMDALLQSTGTAVEPDTWRTLGDFVDVRSGHVRFLHTLTRDAAYETLPYRTRLNLHATAGRLLESTTVDATHEDIAAMSLHFFAARHFRRAADYAMRAGEVARSRYASIEAASFYRRALDALAVLDGTEPERCAVAETLGELWYAVGELSKAESAFMLARRYAGQDNPSRARLGLHLARVRRRGGNPSVALRWLSRSLTELENTSSSEAAILAGRICACYAQVRHEQGQQRAAIKWATRAIRVAQPVQARDVLADAYQYLDVACIALGDYSHEGEAQEALAIWEQLGDRTRLAGLLNHLGIRSYFQGDWPRALTYYSRARGELLRIGDEWNAAIAGLNIIEIRVDQGDTAEAATLARQCMRVFQASSTPAWAAAITDFLARIALKEGRYDEAIRLFTAAREAKAQVGESAHVVDIDARMLECLVYQGHAREALMRCEREIARITGTDLRAVLPILERVRGWALLSLGDPAGAQEAFLLSLEESRAMTLRPDEAAALDALVQVAIDGGQIPDSDIVRERDELFERLGIVAGGSASPTQDFVDVPGQDRRFSASLVSSA